MDQIHSSTDQSQQVAPLHEGGIPHGLMLANRLVNGHSVVCVVANPLIGIDYIMDDSGVRSATTAHEMVAEMGLKPVVVRPRVIRYFLAEYEAAKARLPRRTERAEPSQLASGKALKRASATSPHRGFKGDGAA